MSDGNRIYKTTLSSMAHSLFFSPTSFVWKWWVAFVWAAWFYHIANETLWSPHITTIVGIVIITIDIAVAVVISKDQIATDKASQQLNKKKVNEYGTHFTFLCQIFLRLCLFAIQKYQENRIARRFWKSKSLLHNFKTMRRKCIRCKCIIQIDINLI